MKQEMFKAIEINDTLSLDFWNSESQIKNYCEGILNHNNEIKYRVNVQFKDQDAFVINNGRNDYLIVLPKTELINDEELKLKNIVARTVFLRHELAHILYTDNESYKMIVDNHIVFNMFEDARIENFYSKKYKGTYRLFKSLVKTIYDSMNQTFTEQLNINDFALYCRLREKELEPVIKDIAKQTAYEAMYQKYRYIFHYDYATLIEGVKEIMKEFDVIKQDQQQTQQQQQADSGEKEESQDQEAQKSDEQSDSGEEGEEGDSDSEESEDGESDDEENSDSDSEESDGDSGDSEESGDGDDSQDGDDDGDSQQGEEQDGESEGEEDSDEGNDSSSQDGEALDDIGDSYDPDKSSSEDGAGTDGDNSDEPSEITKDYDNSYNNEQKDKLDETLEDLFEKELQNEKLKLDTFDYSKLLKQVSAQHDNFDLDDYNFDINDFREATVIDYDKISRFVKTKKYEQVTNKHGRAVTKSRVSECVNAESYIQYRNIIARHKKTIAETINFLKLKLKIRDRDKRLSNQLDGKLDQKNLKDLFTNKNMPEVFYRTIKTIKTDSEFYLLIDFSSSMDHMQKQDALTTAIIMTEVCKALNIAYDISIFASTGWIEFTTKTQEDCERIKQILKNNKINQECINTREYNSFFKIGVRSNIGNTNYVFKLKNVKDKHSAYTEGLLASIHASTGNILTGGTPEFESFIAVIKNNRIKPNVKKNLFLINDGMFQPAREVLEMPHNKNITTSNYNGLTFSITAEYYNSVSHETINKIITKKLFNMLVNTYENSNMHWTKLDPAVFETLKQADIFKNPSAYIHLVDSAKYFNGKFTVDYTYMFGSFQNYFVNTNPIDESTRVYIKAIEDAKKYGFNVYGFGIRSNYGKKYLGDNFESFENSADIEANFGLKVRQIF